MTAATIMSNALGERPPVFPSAISRAQTNAAFSSKGGHPAREQGLWTLGPDLEAAPHRGG